MQMKKNKGSIQSRNFRIRKTSKKDANAIVTLVKKLSEFEGKKSVFSKKNFLTEGIGKTRHFSTIVAVVEGK